jgi:transcriptional regulator
MYLPKGPAEHRLPVLLELIAAHPLAAVITLGAGGIVASHIPLVHEDDGSMYGVLRGHVARANGQWSDHQPSVDAVAIFSGPDRYVSPNELPGLREHGKVVPTWDYVVVHATGPLQIKHDAEWLLAHLNAATDHNESGSDIPWHVDDAPPAFIEQLLGAIVGIEIPIRALAGKWKISDDADRHGAMDAHAAIARA